MITKKLKIDKWNCLSKIYSVLYKCIARYGNEVNTVRDNDEIVFFFWFDQEKDGQTYE